MREHLPTGFLVIGWRKSRLSGASPEQPLSTGHKPVDQDFDKAIASDTQVSTGDKGWLIAILHKSERPATSPSPPLHSAQCPVRVQIPQE